MRKQRTKHINVRQWFCLCIHCLPNRSMRKKLRRLDSKRVRQFEKKMLNNMENITPDIAGKFNENFWDLLS